MEPEEGSDRDPSPERAARLAAAFEHRVGKPPAGIWRAPGRVNLIGEHTDYNDGFVLPFAISRSVLAAASPRADDLIRVWTTREARPREFRIEDVAPGRMKGWAAYPAGAAWALAQVAGPVRGADLVLDGNVPSGSGLSSSAAVESAVVVALAELSGVSLPPRDLALAAQRGEVDIVGVPCGVMDQMASVLSREGCALFLDTRTLEWEHVPFQPDAEGFRVVVVDTKAPRQLVDGAYADRRRSCERVSQVLGVRALRDVTLDGLDAARDQLDPLDFRRARHVVTENARVLRAVQFLKVKDWKALGPLLTASHESLRDDYNVSTPELDAVVTAALDSGALGARMTGAGFGGCAIALLPDSERTLLERNVRSAFAAAGFAAPAFLPVRPTDGARRVR